MESHRCLRRRLSLLLICCVDAQLFLQDAAFGGNAKQQQSAQSGTKTTTYRFGAIEDLDYAANELK
jgi:hypothetical protein